MLVDLAKNTAKFTIIISLVGFIIAWAFALNNTFLTTIEINGETIIKFDIQTYINNLTNAWQSNPVYADSVLPTREWSNDGAWNNWEPYFNNLAVMFNWSLVPLNTILYFLRWFAWIQKVGLALIGWDFSLKGAGAGGVATYVYNSYLLQLLEWIIGNLKVPYI